jgi:hypothetical protein
MEDINNSDDINQPENVEQVTLKNSKLELQNKCKELEIKFKKSNNKSELINLINQQNDANYIPKISVLKIKKKILIDIYTRELLEENYYIHREYYIKRSRLCELHGVKIRLPPIPEDISENIIKFIIHDTLGDVSSSWNCSGDLSSHLEGKQECKCFTSNGPISFTPSSSWNILYFLDSRNWINDRFILYRINLSNSSPEWKNIPVNKTQSFENQCNQGRRPRINWESLKPHILQYCEKIFDGTFQEILNYK